MRILLERTWEELQRERSKLYAQNVALRERAAKLETTVQSLTLQAGLSGFEVREKPAEPAKLVLRQVRSAKSN